MASPHHPFAVRPSDEACEVMCSALTAFMTVQRSMKIGRTVPIGIGSGGGGGIPSFALMVWTCA